MAKPIVKPKYIQHAENQVKRIIKLDLLNATAAARKRAMGTHSDQFSKEIYREYLKQLKDANTN